MIQRIQSIFLFFTLAACVLLFFFPVAEFLSDYNYFKLYMLEFKNMAPSTEKIFSDYFTYPLIGFASIIGLISLITIFMYKKRRLQLLLIKICILLNIILIVGVFFGYPEVISKQIDTEASFGIASYFSLISLVFLILANRGIKRDEKLIRSADRLR
ncbi:MAG: DUF4293 domain-containing protein, partial [Bacteroidales bacterium]|nr:DUF4293 domain-containing protein [Bacteroidales bacterium]